jgi:hypothetical protein
MINDPTVTRLTNGVYLTWKEQQVAATAQRIKRLSDGRIMCQLHVESLGIPTLPPTLYFGDYSLLSMSHRQTLEKLLYSRHNSLDWWEILEQVSVRVTKSYQRGEPPIEIRSTDEVKPLEYLVGPFLPKNHPTVLYGDGGAGKGLVALLLGAAARLPWIGNCLGLLVPESPATVFYLDWETTEDDYRRRLAQTCAGNGLGYLDIQYRRCSEPIADEIDDLADMVGMAGTELVVVDSIGGACAGDLNGSDVPTRFFNAIRRFNATVLCIFHQNKSKELYGNRFFWNFARSVWEVKKVQHLGEPRITLGLFHQKFNEGALSKPWALDIEFGDGTITYSPQDLTNVPELAADAASDVKVSLKDRCYNLLVSGNKGLKDLADRTGYSEASVKTTLYRYKELFEKDGDKWCLIDK